MKTAYKSDDIAMSQADRRVNSMYLISLPSLYCVVVAAWRVFQCNTH